MQIREGFEAHVHGEQDSELHSSPPSQSAPPKSASQQSKHEMPSEGQGTHLAVTVHAAES